MLLTVTVKSPILTACPALKCVGVLLLGVFVPLTTEASLLDSPHASSTTSAPNKTAISAKGDLRDCMKLLFLSLLPFPENISGNARDYGRITNFMQAVIQSVL